MVHVCQSLLYLGANMNYDYACELKLWLLSGFTWYMFGYGITCVHCISKTVKGLGGWFTCDMDWMIYN